jgi:hypothetical protein
MMTHWIRRLAALSLLAMCVTSQVEAGDDPLPSWNDGQANSRSSILSAV